MKSLLTEKLEQAQERLRKLEQELQTNEKNPTDVDVLEAFHRTQGVIATLKNLIDYLHIHDNWDIVIGRKNCPEVKLYKGLLWCTIERKECAKHTCPFHIETYVYMSIDNLDTDLRKHDIASENISCLQKMTLLENIHTAVAESDIPKNFNDIVSQAIKDLKEDDEDI